MAIVINVTCPILSRLEDVITKHTYIKGNSISNRLVGLVLWMEGAK